MESTDSSGGPPPQPNLPPGFRFHPTDEELVVHYLKRKASSAPLPVSIIAEVDLYKFDPWELPAKASFGEQEWYFFSPRDRKYPNGARPNRAATSGYWKATGTDKPVLASNGNQKVGVKKALVFYSGKPPKGVKSDWIMHEYRLVDNKPSNNRPPGYDFTNKKNSLRLDDWVLCRIYKKNNGTNRHVDNNTEKDHEMIDYIFRKIPPMAVSNGFNYNNVSRMNNLYPGVFSNGSGGDHQLGLYEGGMMNNNGDDDVTGLMSNFKRSLPVPYWPAVTEEEEINDVSVSSSKRFHGDCSNVMTETTPQQQGGVIGDGIYRTASYQLPGLNWYPS